jgi:hypothetical protein
MMEELSHKFYVLVIRNDESASDTHVCSATICAVGRPPAMRMVAGCMMGGARATAIRVCCSSLHHVHSLLLSC